MAKTGIRNRVRELRYLNGEMTQAALAKAVGVTRQTVIAIENNKYSPSLEAAFKIAKEFGVPITEVFSYRPEEG